MSSVANPLEKPTAAEGWKKQTVEIRSADGSADIYLLLAGLAVAARKGLTNPDALAIAEKTYVDVNIHDASQADKLNSLGQLPANCYESAGYLEQMRAIFEAADVFPATMLDGIIANLRSFDDKNIAEEVRRNPGLMGDLVKKHFHCG